MGNNIVDGPQNGNDGKDVVEYSWGVIHPSGANEEQPLITLSSNDFFTNTDGVVAADVEITFQQIMDALGYTEDDVSVGDLYRFNGKIRMSDNDVFDTSNTTVEIINNFNAFFNFDETVK